MQVSVKISAERYFPIGNFSIERTDKTLLINPPVKYPAPICQNIFSHFIYPPIHCGFVVKWRPIAFDEILLVLTALRQMLRYFF
jgi:hypothetical protein